MPSTLSCVPEDSVGTLPRSEWRLWNGVRAEGLPQTAIYGDYVVQHPTPPNGGGPHEGQYPLYLTRRTVIARGLSVLEEGKAQYTQVMHRSIGRRAVRRSPIQLGDRTIRDCAEGRIAPGSQTMWRVWERPITSPLSLDNSQIFLKPPNTPRNDSCLVRVTEPAILL